MSTAQKNNSILPPLWVLTITLLVGLVWLLVELKEIVILLIVGFAIAYVIEPLIEKLIKYKISRNISFFIVFAGILLVIVVLTLTTLPTILREGSKLVENFPAYINTAQLRVNLLLENFPEDSPVHAFVSKPLDSIQRFGANIIPKVLIGLQSVLLGGYSVTLTILNLFLLPFIVYYLSIAFPNLSNDFLALIPKDKRQKSSQILDEIDHYVSAFVRGQLIVCTILFFLYALGLGALGIELWLILAVIAGFGNLIPYVGTIVGIILASIMAVVTYGDLWHIIYVWIVFAVVQFMEGSIITPRVVGGSLGLSPLIVILAIVAGGSLFGLLGIFLAVPCSAILKVLLKHGRKWLIQQMAK